MRDCHGRPHTKNQTREERVGTNLAATCGQLARLEHFDELEHLRLEKRALLFERVLVLEQIVVRLSHTRTRTRRTHSRYIVITCHVS
jgi:hypothetical protein